MKETATNEGFFDWSSALFNGHFGAHEIDIGFGDALALSVDIRESAEMRGAHHKTLSTFFSFFQFLFFSYTFSLFFDSHSGIVSRWNLQLSDGFLNILDNYVLVKCLHYKLEQFLDLKKDFYRRINFIYRGLNFIKTSET